MNVFRAARRLGARRAQAPVTPAPRMQACGFAVVTAMALASACDSGSPAGPSNAAPPLADGLYMLHLSGDSGRCNDIKNPPAGTVLALSLTATHDNSGMWIARGTTAADGTIEIRLAHTTQITTAPSGPIASGIAVAGSMSGGANDAGFLPFHSSSTRTALVADQPITGVFRAIAKFADGYFGGAVTFSKDGVSSTCPAGAGGWRVNGPM